MITAVVVAAAATLKEAASSAAAAEAVRAAKAIEAAPTVAAHEILPNESAGHYRPSLTTRLHRHKCNTCNVRSGFLVLLVDPAMAVETEPTGVAGTLTVVVAKWQCQCLPPTAIVLSRLQVNMNLSRDCLLLSVTMAMAMAVKR